MAQVARTRQELIADYLDLDDRYTALVRNRSSAQLRSRPGDGAWCPSECIEHVARTNASYLATIKTAIAESKTPAASADRPLTTAGWFSEFFLNAIGPEGRRKLRSPRTTRPVLVEGSVPAPGDSLQKLLNTHQQIRELLAATSQPDLNRIRFKNPFAPLIRFTVGTAFLIMAAHGRRHLLQAERACKGTELPLMANSVGQK